LEVIRIRIKDKVQGSRFEVQSSWLKACPELVEGLKVQSSKLRFKVQGSKTLFYEQRTTNN